MASHQVSPSSGYSLTIPYLKDFMKDPQPKRHGGGYVPAGAKYQPRYQSRTGENTGNSNESSKHSAVSGQPRSSSIQRGSHGGSYIPGKGKETPRTRS